MPREWQLAVNTLCSGYLPHLLMSCANLRTILRQHIKPRLHVYYKQAEGLTLQADTSQNDFRTMLIWVMLLNNVTALPCGCMDFCKS